MTALLIATGLLVVAVLGYMLNLRINRAVSWSAAQHQGRSGDVVLTIVNTGNSRARGVEVQLDGKARFVQPPQAHVNVDPGAVIIVKYFRGLGAKPPSQVTVRWTRRLRRLGVWTTPI